jgi:tetratricopeptide (TPR) repeat protein
MKMLANLFGLILPKKRKVWFEADVHQLLQTGQLDIADQAAKALSKDTPQRDLVSSCLCAEIAFRRGNDEEAEKGFMGALAESPGFAQAHYGLSLLYLEKQDAEAALRHAKFADAAKPNQGRFLAQLGLCQVRLRNYAAAERALRAALILVPEDKASWSNLGIVLVAKLDRDGAKHCFKKALSIDPGFANATQNLQTLEAEQQVSSVQSKPPEQDFASTPANAVAAQPEWARQWEVVLKFQNQGLSDAAALQAESLLVQWADDPRLACSVAKFYASQGDIAGAIELLEAFLIDQPACIEVLVALGQACFDAQRYAIAEEYLRKAVQLGDTSAATQAILGEALHKLERYSEAVTAFERAIALAESFETDVCQKLAAAQVMACDYVAAMASYQKLLDIFGEAKNPSAGGFSLCLTYVGEFDRALKILDRLLTFSPSDAPLRGQRAQIRLLHEDYANGWVDYKYRGLTDSKQFRVLPLPQWSGEPLHGKTIIVLAEQGLGDQVMFASCLPDLLDLLPQKVYLEVVNRVAPTLARSFPKCEIIPTKQDRKLEWVSSIKDADYYIPLGDLPFYFRKSRQAFPRAPYLCSDPQRVTFWRAELAKLGPPPYIGISWRGGTSVTRSAVRSLDPSMLLPIAHAVDATWINLQYGKVEDGLAAFVSGGVQLHHWPEAIADLDEFAALIAALDGVVTACNTTVHYAGALGQKVWILAPKIPEWRYGVSYDEMPWYANVNVYRQDEFDDWDSVVQKIAAVIVSNFGIREGK